MSERASERAATTNVQRTHWNSCVCVCVYATCLNEILHSWLLLLMSLFTAFQFIGHKQLNRRVLLHFLVWLICVVFHAQAYTKHTHRIEVCYINAHYIHCVCPMVFCAREQTNQPNDLQLFDLFFGFVFIFRVFALVSSRIHTIRYASKFCFSVFFSFSSHF